MKHSIVRVPACAAGEEVNGADRPSPAPASELPKRPPQNKAPRRPSWNDESRKSAMRCNRLLHRDPGHFERRRGSVKSVKSVKSVIFYLYYARAGLFIGER
jgi:hypothetical protein